LASQVTSLREVLANKQARGAFGQGRMEAIVRDGLPKNSYEFQFTLSNGKRPDCAVFLPSDHRPLIIDAKFPLEAISALRDARTDEEKKHASQRLRTDVSRHFTDIAERYLIPGETEDMSQILISADKVAKRGGRIETLEFEETPADSRSAIPAPLRKAQAAE